jgi:hypothetical protein
MRIDWYTRTLLTVIAASLMWLCVNSMATPAEAQATGRVYIAGWIDDRGTVYKLPRRDIGLDSAAALPVSR